MNDQQPRDAETLRRENAESHGAPPHFTYPADAPLSEDERQRYAEIAAKLPYAQTAEVGP